MGKRKKLEEMTLKDLWKKIQSKMCTSLREGVAATRVADFYINKMTDLGKVFGPTGCVIGVETGEQFTLFGCGEIYENFLCTGKIENHSGFGTTPVRFYEENFETAPFQIMKFDQTFDKMPYDCRTSIVFDLEKDFLFKKKQPQKGKKKKLPVDSSLDEDDFYENECDDEDDYLHGNESSDCDNITDKEISDDDEKELKQERKKRKKEAANKLGKTKCGRNEVRCVGKKTKHRLTKQTQNGRKAKQERISGKDKISGKGKMTGQSCKRSFASDPKKCQPCKKYPKRSKSNIKQAALDIIGRPSKKLLAGGHVDGKLKIASSRRGRGQSTAKPIKQCDNGENSKDVHDPNMSNEAYHVPSELAESPLDTIHLKRLVEELSAALSKPQSTATNAAIPNMCHLKNVNFDTISFSDLMDSNLELLPDLSANYSTTGVMPNQSFENPNISVEL